MKLLCVEIKLINTKRKIHHLQRNEENFVMCVCVTSVVYLKGMRCFERKSIYFPSKLFTQNTKSKLTLVSLLLD